MLIRMRLGVSGSKVDPIKYFTENSQIWRKSKGSKGASISCFRVPLILPPTGLVFVM